MEKIYRNIIIGGVVLLVLGGFYFLIKNDEKRLDQAVEEARQELLGEITTGDLKGNTGENILYYNAGRRSWVVDLQNTLRTLKEDGKLGEFRFDVIVGEEVISLIPAG